MFLTLVNHLKQSKYMYSEIVSHKNGAQNGDQYGRRVKIGISKTALSHLKMRLELKY